MAFGPRFFRLLLVVFSVAKIVSGNSVNKVSTGGGGGSHRVVECVDPEHCAVHEEKDGQSLSLRELLESLIAKSVSGRTIQKRGKQNTQISGFSSAEKDAILRKHNELRKSVNPPASNMLEMVWSDELANVAQRYASQCNFQHNSKRASQAPSFTSVGENIHAGSHSYDEEGAVQAWFNEDKYYNYDRNSCNHICGHYTQVVWAKSYALGCGIKYCNPLRNVGFGAGYITVCNYGPAGNYIGQKPYEKGSGTTQLLRVSGSGSGSVWGSGSSSGSGSGSSSGSGSGSGSVSGSSSGSVSGSGSSSVSGSGSGSVSGSGSGSGSGSSSGSGSGSVSGSGSGSVSGSGSGSVSGSGSGSVSGSGSGSSSSSSSGKKRKKNRRKKNRTRKNRTKKPRTRKSKSGRRRSKKKCKTADKPAASAALQAGQPATPSSSGSQTSTTWRRTLSSTCQKGRQQALDLQKELQNELNNAQPSSSAWRQRVSRTCSRGRSMMQQTGQQLRTCMRNRG